MSTDDRFAPPKAAVADVGDARSSGRLPVIALGVFTAIQVLWVALSGPLLLSLVAKGALRPPGLMYHTLFEGCLVAGVAPMAWRRGRGSATFLAAIVLHMLNRYAWRAGWAVAAVPIIAGLPIAIVGWLIARGHAVARSSADVPVEKSP